MRLLLLAELKGGGDGGKFLHSDRLLLRHRLELINGLVHDGRELRLESRDDLGNESVLVHGLLLLQSGGQLLTSPRAAAAKPAGAGAPARADVGGGGGSGGGGGGGGGGLAGDRSDLEIVVLPLPGLSVAHGPGPDISRRCEGGASLYQLACSSR